MFSTEQFYIYYLSLFSQPFYVVLVQYFIDGKVEAQRRQRKSTHRVFYDVILLGTYHRPPFYRKENRPQDSQGMSTD